ncbi:unnamed protein product [Rotaria socialis]|uniref:Uncharacterized protein n=1 Tax=Rotaria socialis TaxID=392032 RepID=A0A821GEK3_9BILA|nr:unnamed protein product [Rotaria socialis]
MIHDFDSYSVSFQTAISRIYSTETSFNKSIGYLNPRPEYIRVIIIEWPTKSSITVAHIVPTDIQDSLLSAQRCENFDDYCQQVD